jgi:hypothetical protein
MWYRFAMGFELTVLALGIFVQCPVRAGRRGRYHLLALVT